jgi:large subunit ribosomal protein L3
MSIGLIGRKVGMTQIFQPDGTMVAVSVVQVTPNTVTKLRTDAQDGYTAIQLGHGERKKLTKPLAGQLKDLPKVKTIREFRLDSVDGYAVGQQLTVAEIFAEGELVDITGVSKGQGFAGTVKRHNFSRGPKTHGSDNYRRPGSIGPGTTPGRVYKGLKMGGHMGDERVTIKKLRVVRVDSERNLILVKGSVPGAPGALTFVRKV